MHDETPPHPPPTARPNDPSLRLALWIGFLALAVRGPHLLETVRSVLFGVPILDEAFYDLASRHLLDGTPLGDLNPGFRPLLYPAFLALARWTAGEAGPLLAVAVQHVLGVVVTVLVARYSASLWRSDVAGFVSGASFALAGPPLFYEGRLLITTLFVTLFVLLLTVLGRCRVGLGDAVNEHRVGLAPWILTGVLVALAAQARPNALVFLVAIPGLLWRAQVPRRRKLTRLASAFGAAVATLLCAAVLQAPAIGRFQLVPSSGGINLYLGNERGADGMVPRQDRHVSYGDQYRDSVQLFARDEYLATRPEGAAGAEPTPSDVSRYWLGRTIDEIAAAPGRWLALMARKVWLLVWPPEVPNNLAYDFAAAHETPILRWMPVRWAWLLPLAVFAVIAGWHRCDRRRLAPLLWLGGLHAAAVVLFFVAGRYRIPLWPLAAILAGGVVPTFFSAAQRPRGRRLAVAAACALAVVVAGQSQWPSFLGGPVERPSLARDFFYRSVARLERGEVDGAVSDARAALELEPDNLAAHFQLGTASLAAEDWQQAASALGTAAIYLPAEPRTFNNLGIALERLGHVGDAYAAYLRALDVGPGYSPAWINAALLELRAGRADLAADKVARAEILEDAAGLRTVPRLAARAFVERDQGRPERAAEILAEATVRDPGLTRRLVRENAARIRLVRSGDPTAEADPTSDEDSD